MYQVINKVTYFWQFIPTLQSIPIHSTYFFPHCRKPCLKASTISMTPASEVLPTWVESKPKQRKRLQNVFLDDRGFPDQLDEYDYVLHNINGGPILCKLKHPVPYLDASADPAFYSEFIHEKHKAQMCQDVDLSHLDPDLQEKVYSLIQEFWSLFDSKGVFVQVKNYKCIIDTGNACPIAVKKIFYGKHKTVIMGRCIAALAKVGHIVRRTVVI